MGDLSTILDTISDDVVARLHAGGYPKLFDGKILYGRVEQFANSAPPRIIFTRMSSKFSMRDIYSRSLEGNGSERKQQASMRAIAQKEIKFEVRCWGADPSGIPIDNDDVTEALVDAVVASVQSLAVGSFSIEDGSFTSSTFESAQLMVDGSEFVFGVNLLRPVLTTLAPYNSTRSHAPSDVSPDITDSMTISTGQNQAGCEAP